MPYFSFVMVCYNNWNFTRISVESFFESLNPIYQQKGIEFILVDNGSSDETSVGIEGFKSKYGTIADIVTAHLEHNLGYINGVNIGLSKCGGEIISILNNDLLFCPGWLNGMVDYLEQNQDAGAVAPLLTNGSGLENIILQFQSAEMEEAFYRSKATMNYYAHQIMEEKRDKVIFSNRIVGACVVIKRKTLELVGGLDFWYGIGIFDDDDFSMRVNLAGYRTAIVGSSFVYHIGNATFSKVRTVSNAAVLSNKMKFVHKWKLRCRENIAGLYNSRGDAINGTPFEREKYFVPVSLGQFSNYTEADTKKDDGKRKILMVVDWTNVKSQWLKGLKALLTLMEDKDEISMWIPQTYFSDSEAQKLVNNIDELCTDGLGQRHMEIKIIRDDIPFTSILTFMKVFDAISIVEDDFVNRYIAYLAEHIGLTKVGN